MVGNELEQEIVELFNRDINALYSINQISQLLGKAYPYINKKVNSLIKNKILNKSEIGRSYLCTVNLENDQAVWLLILNEIKKKQNLIKKEEKTQKIIDSIKELNKATHINLVLKIKNRLLIITEHKEDEEILKKSITLKNYKLELYNKREFLDKVLKDKEILYNHTILHGFENYYQNIKEVKGALKVKYSKLIK